MGNPVGIGSRSEIEKFLSTWDFERRNARVSLPFGFHTPGKDMSDRFGQVFNENLTGKSVLDVGTYYGAFPQEAIKRGASHAVGIELDESRFNAAKEICRLNGSPYEIVCGKMEDYTPDDKFDLVLLLAVIHHVPDPIKLMTAAARACRGTVVVEFQDFDHPKAIFQTYQSPILRFTGVPPFQWKGKNGIARLHSWALRLLARNLPLILVGARELSTTYYFSKRAFINTFVTHLKLFDDVKFAPSVKSSSRIIAFCKVCGC